MTTLSSKLTLAAALFGTGTCDTTNKFRVCEDMYGSPFQLAYPDVDRTEFLAVLGANPAVSGNTLYHLPHAVQRLKDITRRGGRVVFINPRRIETAQAGEHAPGHHEQICPGRERLCERLGVRDGDSLP